MKTIIIIFWFLLTMLTMDSLAQSLWEFEPAPSDYFITNNDTSYLTLKNYLQNDSLAFETPYLSVANLFAYYYGNSEKDFILEKLQIFYDTTQPKFNWNNFFSAQVLRGFLGDQGAIEGLDSVIRYSNNMLLKLSAISYLYEVGILDYFQTIKQAFMEQNSLYNGFVQLAQYGSDERFKDEAAALLAGVITDSTDRIKTFSAATNLASFNKLLAIQSLESRFYSSNGEDRLNFFMDLEFIDPDGQPERSMYAIPLETDVYIRSEFFPPTGSAEKGLVTRRYLEPFWINFIKEWYNYESEKIIKSSILRYIEDFEPNIIDSTSSTLELIEDLIDLTDTVYNYSWLGDEQFKNELQSILQLAKSNLQNGDSLACRVQVKTFQGLVDNVYKDSLNTDLSFVTIEGWKFLYWNAQYILDRLPLPPSNPNLLVNLTNSQGTQIPANNVKYYEGSWKDAVNNGDGTFTVITTRPTVSIRVYYEYASLQADNVPAQNNTYTFQTAKCTVQLKNSQGELIDTGTVHYYAGAWRDFGTTVNGVATKELLPVNYSFRMTYAYASMNKQQDISVDPTVIFQTVNAAVELRNSSGNLIDEGTVQYYAGAWRDFGTTVNGVATKELLPVNYSFRMTYAYASMNKQQDISVDPTVNFQTVIAAVELRNSSGNLIDEGTVQYYAGAWRDFGTTVNGVATKELLPVNYSFRMTYAYASMNKQQDISVNPTVVFQTVNAAVQLKNSLGSLIDQGTVQYYAGAWRDFGTTVNGVATKELLPVNYSFRMTYEYVSKDKQQDLSANPVVDFSTVLCSVKVSKTSNNEPITNAEVKYYSGAWRNLGTTNSEGIATKELLPANLSFRASYGSVSQDKQQDISVSNLVEILLNVP